MKRFRVSMACLVFLLGIIIPQSVFCGSAPKAGSPKTINLGGGVELELVWIPPGEFMMGSASSEPGRRGDEVQRKVKITKGFWMGKYEVTQAQWEKMIKSNPSNPKGPRLPVESVSWEDCQKFIQKLNGIADGKWLMGNGGKFRLPTEAEWEYTCRAGTTTRFNTGNSDADLERAGWYTVKSGGRSHSVGGKKPNAWGLYDMHGNVWEWCSDWYAKYGKEATLDPAGPDSGTHRVFRGGSRGYDANSCRSAFRSKDDPSDRWNDLGFRVVME